MDLATIFKMMDVFPVRPRSSAAAHVTLGRLDRILRKGRRYKR
jgi:hypothetical protein